MGNKKSTRTSRTSKGERRSVAKSTVKMVRAARAPIDRIMIEQEGRLKGRKRPTFVEGIND